MYYYKNKFSILKLLISLLSLFLLAMSITYYINYSYSKSLNTFYMYFNQCDFASAKSTFDDKTFITKLKEKSFYGDVSDYFTSIISSLCNEIKNNEIKASQVIPVFKEIKDYDLLGSSVDKLILTLDKSYTVEDSSSYEALLDLAIDKYNKQLFAEALDMFYEFPSSSKYYYEQAQVYIEKCIVAYKEELFAEADKLIRDDYYTKAIELLSSVDTSMFSIDDEEIQEKIFEIESLRDDYLNSLYSEE